MRHTTGWIWALACLPVIAAAQPAADAATAVPGVAYRSVFEDTPRGVETDTLPWKAANAAVGQFPRGHIDILKWEAARDKAGAQPEQPMPPRPGTGQAKP